MVDLQEAAMVGGEGGVSHKLAVVLSMETSQCPKNLAARVVEGLATTWQPEVVF